MEFSDRRDSGSSEELRTSKTYDVPTRHRKVAENMIARHLAKSGTPLAEYEGETTLGNQYKSRPDLGYPTAEEFGNPRTVAHWDHETNTGFQRVRVSGTGAQHEALKKRFPIASHPQDGYGRGR